MNGMEGMKADLACLFLKATRSAGARPQATRAVAAGAGALRGAPGPGCHRLALRI